MVYYAICDDSVESLPLLAGIADVYRPDFKFWKRDAAKRLAKAPNCPERAREATQDMHRQVGPLSSQHDISVSVSGRSLTAD